MGIVKKLVSKNSCLTLYQVLFEDFQSRQNGIEMVIGFCYWFTIGTRGKDFSGWAVGKIAVITSTVSASPIYL
ncbi:hypothetical protein NDI33_19715 [Trichocoleus sp. DQ-A1]